MNNNNEALWAKEEVYGRGLYKIRTTIGIKTATKDRLNKNRAPGQCYDGFIYQLVDLWERVNSNRMASVVSAAGGNQGA